MIVWGGSTSEGYTNTGGIYNPATDSWRPMNTDGAPSPRGLHTAIWTGSKMIVWGGTSPRLFTGGIYDPTTDSWTSTHDTQGPSPRCYHTAVWTGTEMIIWGGSADDGATNTGSLYNPNLPNAASWRKTADENTSESLLYLFEKP